MVDEQIIPRGIKDKKLLDALYRVERHRFVPEELAMIAYSDFPVAIGEDQTISQPYIVALMTECLDLKGNEKVLEIGTGSGYQAAILAELAQEVYSVERFENLGKKAEGLLGFLGYNNIKVKIGDGTLGWIEQSPFDRIIVTAAAPRVPQPLIEQLIEGGKLILPLGESPVQVLTLIEKGEDGKLKHKNICDCMFVPLIGKYSL